ncbi:hypothetical protein ONE63_002790 [Megalurothrips usitatus]|uniref:NADP-dependent oxidoreductase domain-containing protein n=1 Tax=Megalurothrips usitatus TaxID=439358 RepID=A0AAV7X8D7_9NEOP|nr:hypothetical protein ONE63_002790 [Megalurothrips usitatus]
MSPPQLAPRVPLNDGTSIPAIGLGTYRATAIAGGDDNSTLGDVEKAVLEAIDAGYRLIDGALLYETEDQVGRAVAAKISQGAVTRADMYIVTKLWNNAHRPDLVEAACRQSLANLGMDYVDLYLMHWPTAFKEGPDYVPRGADGQVLYSDVDILDTYRAMEELVRKGLVKSLGVSNFNSAQMRRLLGSCSIKPVINQVEAHPYLNQKRLVALCRAAGVQESPWSLGKQERLLDDKTLAAVGRTHGKAPGQVILRYLVQSNLIPIPKSVTKARIQENFSIFDFELSPQDMATIDALNKDRRICPFTEALGHPEYPFAIDY